MEETLIFLAYCAYHITMPTLNKWGSSYDGWLYRNGLLRRVRYLETQKLLARKREGSKWVWKVTAAGRQSAQGGREPERLWQRRWDGWWREIVFDLPVTEHRARSSLVRWLRANGFGYLQDSVWISPDRIDTLTDALNRHRENTACFTILECQCARGFTNAGLVNGAWPFDQINAAYQDYERFARDNLKRVRRHDLHPREVFTLLQVERTRWREAFTLDPLLPKALWPRGYRGHNAWQLRRHLLTTVTTRAIHNL